MIGMPLWIYFKPSHASTWNASGDVSFLCMHLDEQGSCCEAFLKVIREQRPGPRLAWLGSHHTKGVGAKAEGVAPHAGARRLP
jgi:hypothetical protein